MRNITLENFPDKRFIRHAELSHECVSVCDRQCRTLWANSVWHDLFGREKSSPDEPFSMLHPDDVRMAGEAWTSLVEKDAPIKNIVYRYSMPGGRYHLFASSAYALDSSNEPLYCVIAHDITDQSDIRKALPGRNKEDKELETRLMHAEKLEAIGRLAGGMAHDINNILGGILGMADILQERMDPESPLRKYPLCIIEQSERAANLMAGILSFARKKIVHIEQIDLRCHILNVVNLLEHTIGKTICITTHFSDDILIISGDAAQMETVFLNLGINARDAMPQGGTLEFRAEKINIDGDFIRSRPFCVPDRAYVHIMISDTGTGQGNRAWPCRRIRYGKTACGFYRSRKRARTGNQVRHLSARGGR
jgi:hypothetical protein